MLILVPVTTKFYLIEKNCHSTDAVWELIF